MTQVILLAAVAILALIASLLYAAYMRRQRLAAPDAALNAPIAAESKTEPNETSLSREVLAVADWLSAVAFEQTGCVVGQNPPVRRRIVEAAQLAVRDLEDQAETVVALPELISDASGPTDLEVRLTRDVIELLVRS